MLKVNNKDTGITPMALIAGWVTISFINAA